jgi:hypothetical protein
MLANARLPAATPALSVATTIPRVTVVPPHSRISRSPDHIFPMTLLSSQTAFNLWLTKEILAAC